LRSMSILKFVSHLRDTRLCRENRVFLYQAGIGPDLEEVRKLVIA
jgi:hypothetical protein